MARGWAVLIFVSIVFVTAGGTAVVIWQAHARGIPLLCVAGGLAVVIGAGSSLLNWAVTDEYLRRHFGGDQNARRMREMWRGGWVGILVGAALIAVGYFLGTV